ncbi:MAG: hypothetical protein K2L45_06090 [Muribaculaceae bacterium]|nr:hypothetical protein [Muribaculaceae bacterium]
MKKHLLLIATMVSAIATASANEYTFVFDGDNSLGELPRQTDEKTLEYVDGFSLTEEGINFTISKTDGTGNGFALINAGGTNAGIYVSSGIGTKIELTVPGGTITSAQINMSGYALTNLDVVFNGVETESEKEGSMYYWLWSDEGGKEKLSIEWGSTFMARYIHSIEVTYTPDLGGKQECGLSFSKKSVEGMLGERFSSPTLRNPNNLPINWTSSNENVATVDQNGKLTLISSGITIITASTEGNDEYAAGNAKYELTVIPVAKNFVQMKEEAPNVSDKVKVNFPMTVTFANGSYAYVTDSEGNAGCIHDLRNQSGSSTTVNTIYKIGNVIPAGWIATNATIYESVIWEGKPDKVTENVTVEYPEVTSVTPEDADRVVILKNVTFEKIASGTTKGYGETPDNKRYEFQDTYETSPVAVGTYDVTVLVKYSKVNTTEYFYLVPLAYQEASESKVEAAEIKDAKESYYDLTGKKIDNPKSGVYVKVSNYEATKVIVK